MRWTKMKFIPEHLLTWPLKGRSSRVADTASSTFDKPPQQFTSSSVSEDSRLSEESPSQLLAREMSPMSVDSPSKTNLTESRQTESEEGFTTKESTPKSSPRCLLTSLTLISRVVSDRIKTYSAPASPASYDRSTTTPAGRMLIDTPPHHTSSRTLEEEMTEFWMGSSRSEYYYGIRNRPQIDSARYRVFLKHAESRISHSSDSRIASKTC